VTPPNQPSRRVIAGSPFAQPAVEAGPVPVYEVGDRVTHDRHGMGKVILVGYPNVLRIDFGVNGVRQLPSSDAGLTAL
jgi:hypothetical protein